MIKRFGTLFKLTFLLAFLSCSIQETFSQDLIQDVDYIVLSNGRRLDGSILRNSGQLDFEIIEFNRRGETIKYTPGQLEGFGLGSGEYFLSLDLPDLDKPVFAQILASGPVSLIRYGKYFYAGETKAPQKLGEIGSKPSDDSHEKVLMEIMAGDCMSKVKSLIRGIKITEVDLVWLFRNYYECKKEDGGVIYGQLAPELVWSRVAGISVFQTGVKTDRVSGNRSDIFTLSPVVQGHLGIRLNQIRKYPRISFEASLAYEFFNYQSDSKFESGSASFSGTEKAKVSMISVPVQINYLLAKKKRSEYFIGGGVGFGLTRAKSTYAVRDQRYGNLPYITLEEGSFASMKGTMAYFQGALGSRFGIGGDMRMEVALRVRSLPGYYRIRLHNNDGIYDRLEAGLGINLIF